MAVKTEHMTLISAKLTSYINFSNRNQGESATIVMNLLMLLTRLICRQLHQLPARQTTWQYVTTNKLLYEPASLSLVDKYYDLARSLRTNPKIKGVKQRF